MVIIFNKSNRPIGIAGQSVLPDKEIRVKDKDAYCEVVDEEGNATGEKKLIPGLKALEIRGFVTIREVEEAKKEEPKEEAPKKKSTRSRAKKEEPKEVAEDEPSE